LISSSSASLTESVIVYSRSTILSMTLRISWLSPPPVCFCQ